VFLLLIACLPDACLPPDPILDDTGGDDTGIDTFDPGELVSTAGSEHCGEIAEDEVWAEDLNPHVLSCAVTVTGGTLILGPGTQVLAAQDSGLALSRDGGARLRVLGSEDAPVILEPDIGGGLRGHWQGLFLADSRSEQTSELRWLTLAGTGASDGVHRPAALFVETPDLVVEEVLITESSGYGFALSLDGSFSEDSDGLHVQASAASAFAEVWATGTIPDGDLTGNDVDAIDLPGGSVTESAYWDAKDVAYRLINDAYVDGTTESPAVLTLGPGTTLLFGDGRGLYVGTSGAASLIAEGTSESPVVFRGDRKQAGSWAGVGIRASDIGSVLTHFELAYGGTDFPLDGALHLEDAAATVDHGHVHDNAECGVWLEHGTSAVGTDMTWGNNAGGDLCRP
jgi:hypothetical protein